MSDERISDLLRGVVDATFRRQTEAMERMMRMDVGLIGVDVEHVLAAGRVSERIGAIMQQLPDQGYIYRGLVLDGDVVIDHCWQIPFEEAGSGLRYRPIRFVYAGSNVGRMHFAREHSLDQRVVLLADPDRLRGRRERLIYISSGETQLSLHERDKHLQARQIVDHLNRGNQWPAVNPYGD